MKEANRANPIFANLNCDEILYRIKISTDKFDYPAFVESVGQNPTHPAWGDITCPSRADYHAHIAWTDEGKQIRFQVGFYSHDPGQEKIPKKVIYAENCMVELGQFFKNETAQAHIHANFEFKSSRKSRFPLPLRTTIGACKADIDAVGLRLADAPSGISQVWLMNRKDRDFDAQVYANRKITFGDFSIVDELKEILSVIDSLTEEVKL